MIDIHTHLLPQIDDGPQDWDECLAMIRQAVRDGIEGAVCTPHILSVLDEQLEEKIQYKFRQLQDLIQRNGISFPIWLGSEIHCQSRFSPKSKIATYNGNGRYLLMELPLAELPVDAGEQLFQLTLQGVTPVLAHPERNALVVKNIELAFQLVQQGVLMQINAGSLTGVFGKTVRQTAFEMMKRRMVHAVASDSHNSSTRPMLLKRAYDFTAERWGKNLADLIFITNPKKILHGEKIEPEEPQPPVEQKPFLKKIFGLS